MPDRLVLGLALMTLGGKITVHGRALLGERGRELILAAARRDGWIP